MPIIEKASVQIQGDHAVRSGGGGTMNHCVEGVVLVTAAVV